MGLLVLDFLIISVLLISAALSMVRGFTKEIMSIAAWVGAVYAAIFLAPSLKPLLDPYIKIDWVVNLGSLLLVFLVMLVSLSLTANSIAKTFQGSSVGVLDHSLGVLFGLARGAVIACLGYFLAVLVTPENEHPRWIADAKSRPLLQTGTRVMITLVPLNRLPFDIGNIESFLKTGTSARELRNAGEKALRQAVENELFGSGDAQNESQDKTDTSGYKRGERSAMERLIRNMEGLK